MAKALLNRTHWQALFQSAEILSDELLQSVIDVYHNPEEFEDTVMAIYLPDRFYERTPP